MESDKDTKHEPFFFQDLEKMGISSDFIVVTIMKIIVDFKRGVPQFVLEEKTIQDELRIVTQEKSNLLVQTIFSVRTFLLTIMGFSLTAIGIVLSVLASVKDLFGHVGLLYTGMVFLGLNVLGSVIYILYIHTLDGNLLSKQLNLDRATGKKLQELIQEHYSNPNTNFEQYLIKKKEILESKKDEEKSLRSEKKDWWPHILGILFLLGILSIVLSFILR